ncbi:putative isoamylase [Medicago truncatula]|uniref:isoamylase n=1 Tax=Medicago truncatula TaxID=3880 RepID=G7LIX1_MEDTR|nr:isoamylase 1, chloroplastic isoform X1 [Medicago truncatula]AET05099.2 isoamylase-type starch debranching enzyme [Medicago truncatula]RHN43549.1 putative isoamylase [Medicago truncatula]
MACIPHILSPLSHSTTLANLINITNFEIHNRTSIIISPNSRPKKKKKKIFAIGNRVGVDTETAVIEIEKRQLQLSKGHPSPYGATPQEDGVNFAINSLNSLSATLCFFTLSDFKNNKVTEYITLDPLVNKTGCVWHVFLKGDFKDMLYAYKFDGKFSPQQGHYYDSSRILIDPYAKAVISRGEFGEVGPDGNCWPQMAGMVPFDNEEFDWEGDLPLKYPQKDLIIYEMHVRGFTKHESSKAEFPGTYLGVVEKLDHLKELGVNCIELMPCHEFNELEYYSYNAIQGDYRVNFWGYSTINYFSPMIRYSSAGIQNCGRDGINEMKLLIKEAHKRGIEVIMDVVFNHTAEGNEKGPIISFRGVDNSVYYMVAPKGEFYNYSGCGNTFNCNHPVVRKFIVDCLRYWVTEMHVDGFRFDLASIMTRSSSLWNGVNVFGAPIEGDFLTTGTPLSSPPLIDMISIDPILRGVKLIAEAWDAGGLYQVGTFPHWGIWSEWNGKYRDTVRQFIKGTDGFAGAFAECICGSPNLYQGGRKPWNSINLVCAHDGFTLADLVTYNNKHNLPNGEDNNDGENHNSSWNCGEEGEFVSASVKKMRKRQMRNFFLSLMVSQGVPMIFMGDEYGHTKGGNNNTYCHDNYLNYFRWDKKEESSSDFFRFCRLLTKFRQECESLGLDDFPTSERLQWHGHFPVTPDWSESSRFVAFTLMDLVKGEVYVAFNTSHLPFTITLPERPGYRWEPLVDTSKKAPYDFLTPDLPGRDIAIQQYAQFLDANMYPMLSYSSIILLRTPDVNA